MTFLNLFDRFIKKKDVYFKHSKEEQFTGNYWHDGKKIYSIVKQFSLQGVALQTINLNIQNLKEYINCDFRVKLSNGVTAILPTHDSGTGHFIDRWVISSTGDVRITTTLPDVLNSATLYVTVFYVKDND